MLHIVIFWEWSQLPIPTEVAISSPLIVDFYNHRISLSSSDQSFRFELRQTSKRPIHQRLDEKRPRMPLGVCLANSTRFTNSFNSSWGNGNGNELRSSSWGPIRVVGRSRVCCQMRTRYQKLSRSVNKDRLLSNIRSLSRSSWNGRRNRFSSHSLNVVKKTGEPD